MKKAAMALATLLAAPSAWAYFNIYGFWTGNNPYKLVFGGGTPTKTWSCTNLTIWRKDSSNRNSSTGVTNITLSGTNAYFFSDINCHNSITTASIPNGSTNVVVYYGYNIAGAGTVVASAPGLIGANTGATVSLDNNTWIGTAGDGKWSTASNWQGNAVPGVDALVHFDTNCTSCNATYDAGVVQNPGTIFLHQGYTGIVTQGTGVAMTLSSSSIGGFIEQWSGTFQGSNSTITLSQHTPGSLGGWLEVWGGTFNSTTGTLLVNGDFRISGGTFNHNNGTIQMDTGQGSAFAYTGTVNNLTHTKTAALAISGSPQVIGTLTLNNATGSMTSGTLLASGPVSASAFNGGTATLTFNTSTTQTVTGVAGGILPNVVVNATGTVTFSGTIDVLRNFTVTAGTTVFTGTTLEFVGGAGTIVSPGTAVFNNVTLAKTATTANLFGSGTIAGNFLVNTTGNLNGTLWQVAGNFTVSAAAGGSGNVTLNGTGAQTITQSGGTMTTGLLKIEKTAGTATLASNVSTNGNVTVNNGALSLNTHILNVNAGTGTMTVNGATSVLQCNGGCGAGTACNQGADLLCTTLSLTSGGTVTP